MLSRLIARVALLLAGAVAIAGGASAQTRPPQGPMPPVHDLVLCAIELDTLLGSNAEGVSPDQRVATAEIIAALYRQDRFETIARVENERGPLAWSLFVPGEPSAAEKRLDELHGAACMREPLRRGAASSDPEAQVRSQAILNRYDEKPAISDRFFVEGTSAAALRVELPPSELIVPGGLIAGRVVVAEGGLEEGVGTPVEGLGEGLLAEVDGQTVRVTGEGLFALRAPEQAGTYTIEVRHQGRPLLVPVESAFTIARRGDGAVSPGAAAGDGPTAVDAPARPEVACPGFDRYLDAMLGGEDGVTAPADCAIAVPRVLLPEQRLVVLGQIGNRSGRATRAFLGPWEVPLLARTPLAAVFDVSAVPGGLHAFTLYEGGFLLAAAPVRRLRLIASSDRTELARGDVATFDVRVEGLPRSQPAVPGAAEDAGGAGAVAFLDYVNRSPEIGTFLDRPDRFTVAIAQPGLTPAPEPARVEDQATLLRRIETTMVVVGSAAAVAASPSIATEAGSNATFTDVQRYRGTGDGGYHVQVSVRLPGEIAKHGPAVVAPNVVPRGAEAPAAPSIPANPIGEPLVSTGIDERGAFAAIDGRRLYFSPAVEQHEERVRSLAGPQAVTLFDSSCSGTCQCSIQSWEHADELAAQVAALDRSRPEWRSVTATADTCGCDQARAACYGKLSLECRTRCKRFFESSRTEHVSGFAIEPSLGACSDRGAACAR